MTNKELLERCEPINGHKDGRDGWVCKKCGSTIMGKQVAHPIWDGPFPCSGGGQCRYETVPYCPTCDKTPNFHGAPIQL